MRLAEINRVRYNATMAGKSRSREKSLDGCRKKTVEELVVTISHEINNPLQIILALSEELLQQELPRDVRDRARGIHEMAERIKNVIRLLQQIKAPKTGKYAEDIDMIELGPPKREG